MFPDTCEIEEGETGQFDLFRNGELFMQGSLITIEGVKKKLTESGQDLFTNR